MFWFEIENTMELESHFQKPNKYQQTTTTTTAKTSFNPYKFTKMVEIVCMFSETLWGLIQFTNIKHFPDIIFIQSLHINQH